MVNPDQEQADLNREIERRYRTIRDAVEGIVEMEMRKKEMEKEVRE